VPKVALEKPILGGLARLLKGCLGGKMGQTRFTISEASDFLDKSQSMIEELIFGGKITVQAYSLDFIDEYVDLKTECVKPLISGAEKEIEPIFVLNRQQTVALKHSTASLPKITLSELRIHISQIEIARELIKGEFSYNSDFTQIHYHQHSWSLKPQMGQVIKFLFEQHQKGIKEVSVSEILVAINHKGNEQRVDRIFRLDSNNGKHPCWDTLVKQKSRGVYYLNINDVLE
jgi:hypothetical protein